MIILINLLNNHANRLEGLPGGRFNWTMQTNCYLSGCSRSVRAGMPEPESADLREYHTGDLTIKVDGIEVGHAGDKVDDGLDIMV